MSIKIEEMVENPHNFNEMSRKTIEKLKTDFRYRKEVRLPILSENIVLRPLENGKYEIVDGHQRIIALRELGYSEIPIEWIEIREYRDERESFDDMESRNIKGRVNPIKYAEYLRGYIEKFNLKQKELSEIKGISETQVSEILGILELPKLVLEDVEVPTSEVRRPSLNHYIELTGIKDEALIMKLWEGIKKGTTIRELREEKRRLSNKVEKIRELYDVIPENEAREKAIAKIEPIIYEKEMTKKLANSIIAQELGVYLPTREVIRASYLLVEKMNKFKEAFPKNCEYKDWEDKEDGKLHFMIHIFIDKELRKNKEK